LVFVDEVGAKGLMPLLRTGIAACAPLHPLNALIKSVSIILRVIHMIREDYDLLTFLVAFLVCDSVAIGGLMLREWSRVAAESTRHL